MVSADAYQQMPGLVAVQMVLHACWKQQGWQEVDQGSRSLAGCDCPLVHSDNWPCTLSTHTHTWSLLPRPWLTRLGS